MKNKFLFVLIIMLTCRITNSYSQSSNKSKSIGVNPQYLLLIGQSDGYHYYYFSFLVDLDSMSIDRHNTQYVYRKLMENCRGAIFPYDSTTSEFVNGSFKICDENNVFRKDINEALKRYETINRYNDSIPVFTIRSNEITLKISIMGIKCKYEYTTLRQNFWPSTLAKDDVKIITCITELKPLKSDEVATVWNSVASKLKYPVMSKYSIPKME